MAVHNALGVVAAELGRARCERICSITAGSSGVQAQTVEKSSRYV